MTARPPEPDHDALSAEERDLAARLARLDAASGPSAALDASILSAARAATPSRSVSPTSRRARRWPSAIGAAAVLVAAVGLAWQLRPMFELPTPLVTHAEHAGDANGAGAESDTVVQVESVPRREAPVAAVGNAPAQAAPAASARKASPVAGGGAPRVAAAPAPARKAAAHPSVHDFVDEAMPPPPPPAPQPAQDSRAFSATSAKPEADAAGMPQAAAAASRARREAVAAPLPDVSTDARLPTRDWLIRIRARRDAGDVAGARASLARFVIAHPRVAVPADLRPLLRDDDPWSP
ncbi:hypothetical protein [Lysobacter sp. HA18]